MTPYDEVEKMKAEFHSHGSIQSLEAPLSAIPAKSEGKFVRVIYPFQNDRYEIHGASQKELDDKEKQIRARYSEAAK